jgi:hypothetical protein
MFNIHDSPGPQIEQIEHSVRSKSRPKPNPNESAARGKRKRASSRRDGEGEAEEDGHQDELESGGSSLDIGREPPPLRESSVSAETTTSLTAMSSVTIPPESTTSTVPADALGRQLTTIRRLFFTPTESCTQQTFLVAHESVVSLLGEMRLAMHSAAPAFSTQREEAIRFVTAIGVACRILVLKLDWPSPADDVLLAQIHGWDTWIRRSWEGWTMQFIRLVSGWFGDAISPNNVLRELSASRGDAPRVPLVAVGGDNILFESLGDMSNAFKQLVLSADKSMDDKRYWAITVLRALVLLLGDGIDFSFIEGAFSPAIDLDAEEEQAQTLLETFEAAQPHDLHDEGNNDDEEEDQDDFDIVDEDGDSFVLRFGGSEDGNEDEETVPFFFFPSRRGGLEHPEQNAAKDVPIVGHRKSYSGHCNVQTVVVFLGKSNSEDQRCQLLRPGR